MSDRALRQAELKILNAPFEERGWESALEAVAEATRSHAAQLLGIGGPLLIPLNMLVGPPASFGHYLEDADLHGACNWRIGSTTTPMAIQHEGDYAAYRLANDTSDYDDAMSDMDIQYGCQSALLLDSRNLLGLAVLRGRRDGPSTAETLASFAYLRDQVARAVRMQIALDGEASELMVGDLDTMQGATLLLDRHGCIAALTSAAEKVLEDGPLRRVGLAVELADRAENAPFARLMARMLRGKSSADAAQMRVGRSPSHPLGRWRLFMTSLPERVSHGLGFEPRMALTLRPLG